MMSVAWDSLEMLQAGDELQTAITETITIFAGLSIILVLLYLKREYPKLTKKGFLEFLLGVSLFTSHFLFDLLDTLVTKEVNGQTSIAYELFDILDAVFSFLGLFVIGYAFYRIAQYGMELWEGA